MEIAKMDIVPVSAVMPVYNGLPYIAEAIASLQKQTVRLAEIVVVDGGSDDGTLELLNELSQKDSRLRVIPLGQRGLSHARNRSLREASESWITCLDADDVAEPNQVERQLAFIKKNPEVLLVGCSYRFIDAKGKKLGVAKNLKMKQSGRFDPMVDPNIPQQGVIYRRKEVLAVGGYPQFDTGEDYDLWLRLAEIGPLGFLDEILVNVRILATGLSLRGYYDLRVMWAYAKACTIARQSGEVEPSLSEWKSSFRPSPKKIARWKGAYHFRMSAAYFGQGYRFKALGQFVAAVFANPVTVWNKVWQYSLDWHRE